jgi:DnaJ-class molecular chaperone
MSSGCACSATCHKETGQGCMGGTVISRNGLWFKTNANVPCYNCQGRGGFGNTMCSVCQGAKVTQQQVSHHHR